MNLLLLDKKAVGSSLSSCYHMCALSFLMPLWCAH